MSEDQNPQQVAAAPFQFAYRGPGLSVSVTSADPQIILQYAAITFGGSLREGTPGPAPATLSTSPEAGTPTPAAAAPETPKQTRSRAKDKEEPPKAEPVAAPEAPAKVELATAPQVVDKDKVMEMTVSCFGKDRAKVAALLAQFGVKRFSELREDQMASYAAGCLALAQELKV